MDLDYMLQMAAGCDFDGINDKPSKKDMILYVSSILLVLALLVGTIVACCKLYQINNNIAKIEETMK